MAEIIGEKMEEQKFMLLKVSHIENIFALLLEGKYDLPAKNVLSIVDKIRSEKPMTKEEIISSLESEVKDD